MKSNFAKDWWARRKERQAEEDRKWVEEALQASKVHDVPPAEVVHAVFNEPSQYEYNHEPEHYEGQEEVYNDYGTEYYDHDAAYEHEKRRSKVGMFVTLGVVGGLFGLLICGFSYLANSADKAGPSADSGMEALKASIAPTPSVNPTLNGTHISFVYPSAFDVVTHPANLPNTQEHYALSSKGDYRKTIQVYVESEPSLTLDSGYLVRTQQKDKYTPASIKVAGEPAIVMVKNDFSERTLYWEHQGNLVIMSATGAGTDMASWISVIANSLRWVK